MSEKDQKILKDAKKDNIPIFVFTAKDKLSVIILSNYLQQCAMNNCPQEHVKEIAERINEFMDWQVENMDKVELPD